MERKRKQASFDHSPLGASGRAIIEDAARFGREQSAGGVRIRLLDSRGRELMGLERLRVFPSMKEIDGPLRARISFTEQSVTMIRHPWRRFCISRLFQKAPSLYYALWDYFISQFVSAGPGRFVDTRVEMTCAGDAPITRRRSLLLLSAAGGGMLLCLVPLSLMPTIRIDARKRAGRPSI